MDEIHELIIMIYDGIKDGLFLLALVMALTSGCESFSAKTPMVVSYTNRSVVEAQKELEAEGLTCFHSELVIIEEGTGHSVVDSKRRRLNCSSFQKKMICPEKKTVTLIYEVSNGLVVSKMLMSGEKQCF